MLIHYLFLLHRAKVNFLRFSSTDKTRTFTTSPTLYRVSGCFTVARRLMYRPSRTPISRNAQRVHDITNACSPGSISVSGRYQHIASGSGASASSLGLAFRFHSNILCIFFDIRSFCQFSANGLSDLHISMLAHRTFLQRSWNSNFLRFP